MQVPLEIFTCLFSFLLLTLGLPIPTDSNTASFGVFPLAYRRRIFSSSTVQSSAAGHSPVRKVWGGTSANTSICRYPALWTGRRWWLMGFLALVLIALYGLLAFVMWGIMSVDLPRLMVWKRTGNEQRR